MAKLLRIASLDWGNGDLLTTLPGLSEGSSYVVRIYAANSALNQSAWSPRIQFTTPFEQLPPTLGEPSVTANTTSTVDVSCEVTRGPAEEAYLVWAHEDQGETDPTTWASALHGGSVSLGTANTGGVYTTQLSGLPSGTVYRARIVASNFRGTTWTSAFRMQTARAPEDLVLTAYYDFEPDGDPYNDPAGVHADDLVGLYNPLLSTDVSSKANGSSQSASFDGDRVLYTDAWSQDLGPDRDAMTIMFWVKGAKDNQENTAIRVISTQTTATGGASSRPSWLVFGTEMDFRTPHPDGNYPLFAPDAKIGEVGATADTAEEAVWHHVAFVWSNSGDPVDGGAYAETYLDGISVGVSHEDSEWDGYDISNPDGQLIIGGHEEDAGKRAFTGLLDEIALFAGVVPASDIAAIAAGQIKPADLVVPSMSMANWLSDYELAGQTGFSDDFDGDGLVNGLEYALGSQPNVKDIQAMTIAGNAGVTTLKHPHNALISEDVELSYEWSSDLKTFQKSGETFGGLKVSLSPFRNVPSEGLTSVTVETVGDADKLFFRMSAEPTE